MDPDHLCFTTLIIIIYNKVVNRFKLFIDNIYSLFFVVHIFQYGHQSKLGFFQPVQVIYDVPYQKVFGADGIADAVDNFVHAFQHAI